MFNNNNKTIFDLNEFNMWDSSSVLNYIIHNYKQFLLLLLAIIIVIVIDYINYYNSLIYGVMQVIPGLPNTNTPTNIKSKKNKRSKS